MGTYTAGTKVRLSVTFTDNASNPIDPTTVSLKYSVVGFATTTQTYNPGNVIRDGVGLYHYDLDTTGLGGNLVYEWIATGTGQAEVTSNLTIVPAPL